MSDYTCPNCHGKGATAPNGVKYCNCDDIGMHDDLGTLAGLKRMETTAYRTEIEEAGHLLDDALYQLERTDHRWDCPRLRDDCDCRCGLSDVKARIREWLRRA